MSIIPTLTEREKIMSQLQKEIADLELAASEEMLHDRDHRAVMIMSRIDVLKAQLSHQQSMMQS